MLKSLLMLCLACLPLAAHAGDAETAATRFREAQQAVHAHTSADGFEVDSSPAAVTALQAQWAAARDLVAALLDRAPGIAPATLTRQAKRSAGLAVYALRLDPNAILIDADSGAFGTVFLFRRGDDGRYQPVLALDAAAGERVRLAPALAAWQPGNAGSSCRSRRSGEWYRCGPMTVERLIRLPAEADGGRRFAILGSYVLPMGGTVPHQLTIWRWDGRTATPLLARTFAQTLTQPVFVEEDKRGFALRVKEEFQSFTACEECGGRQTTWRFDLPATGAAPPRVRSLSTELDLVDRFYARLAAHRPTGDLAAPSVAARLRDMEVNMLGSWRYLSRGKADSQICVDAISFDRPQIFRIVRRGGRLWIANVAFARPHACGGPGAHF